MRIPEKIKNKKVSIDLMNGENAERFLSSKVDRDVFDLEYHDKIKYKVKFNLMHKDNFLERFLMMNSNQVIR